MIKVVDMPLKIISLLCTRFAKLIYAKSCKTVSQTLLNIAHVIKFSVQSKYKLYIIQYNACNIAIIKNK